MSVQESRDWQTLPALPEQNEEQHHPSLPEAVPSALTPGTDLETLLPHIRQAQLGIATNDIAVIVPEDLTDGCTEGHC